MIKILLKDLSKELKIAHKKVHDYRWQKSLDRTKARLTYEKLQLIKSRQSTEKVQRELDKLESGKIEYPPMDKSKVRTILAEEKEDIHNLSNVVTFLRNQRVYNELLERYNPGLTMSQRENVQKTASMVGLAIPERLK